MSAAKDKASREGRDAFFNQKPRSACPHHNEGLKEAWLGGYSAAQQEVAPDGYTLWKQQGINRTEGGYVHFADDGTHTLTPRQEDATRFIHRDEAKEAAAKIGADIRHFA